jgi:FtsP/CotA-like multicopper oxidase with cupredoxin domain
MAGGNHGDRPVHARLALTFALLAVLVLFVPATASAAGKSPCPRPVAGSVVAQPPDLYSVHGLLSVVFDYFTTVDRAGRTLFCFVTPSGMESPTLHINPGDTLEIKLTNMVPAPPASAPSEVVSSAADRCGALTMTIASVNIHFHGTNTPPTCHADEVIHTLVNSGQTFTYRLKIPRNEPPGLYWYHPHVHGLSEAAVQGGASGVIEVEGIANIQPALNGLPARYLVIRDQLVANPPRSMNARPPPGWDLSLNYVPIPYPKYPPAVIRMQAGGEEFWRVTNACADTMIDLQLLYDGKPQPLQIAAFDGVPTGSQDGTRTGTLETQTDILLPPAGRAEFIVAGPKFRVRDAMLVTRAVNTGPAGDHDPARPLAVIRTVPGFAASPRSILHTGPANRQRFEGLANAKVTARRTLYFSESTTFPPDSKNAARPPDDDQGIVKFFITVEGAQPRIFSPTNPPAIVTRQGAVEDWTIENRSKEVHVFHIHQIHFLLLAVNGVPVAKDRQQFYDTYPVGFWKGKGPYPSIKVRMDFRGPVVGDFVYHCHILEHEDGGMMAIIRVLPRKSSGAKKSMQASHV